MIPLSMESIFLILSGVILVAGVFYWFWSHIQLTQKKVQLLENAVFELRGMMGPGPPVPAPAVVPAAPASPPRAATPVYQDLEDDDWGAEREESTGTEVEPVSTPLDQLDDTLAPGGRIVGVEKEEDAEQTPEQFKEMFLNRQETAPNTPESLDSMPVKELRRLAEQRGIAGAADMRKKEILAALRRQIRPAGEADEERVVDLTESGAVVLEEN
jgi:hypothetical protein